MEDNRQGFGKGIMVGASVMLVILTIIFYIHESMEEMVPMSDAALAGAVLEDKINEVNDYIDGAFVFDVDSEAMITNALKGYVSGLQDPYSAYYTAEEMEKIMESMEGSYYGIGIRISQKENEYPEVINVFSGSPAEEAGIREGDRIVAVNGEDVLESEWDDIASVIRGEEGSLVDITVQREEAEQPITMSVERRDVNIDTVSYEMLEKGLGYICLSEFDNVSVEQMKDALETLTAQEMEKLILDLRDNPGGLLTSVVDIADLFLPKDANIFYMENKAGDRETYDCKEDAVFNGKMAVLVNENSASAAEVLSGALKDNERGVLVGTTTFGKGIVQSYFDLVDGAGLKLTTAHYFTPKGTDIHGVGITPDVFVEDSDREGKDPQLDQAVSLLENK